jgi:DNA repair protein RadC
VTQQQASNSVPFPTKFRLSIPGQCPTGAGMKKSALLRFSDPAFVRKSAEDPVILDLIRPHFSGSVERLLLLAFDDRGRLLDIQENHQCHGRMAVLSPSLVRRAFAAEGATNLILVHNHPSGEASPSAIDIDLTRRMAAACSLAGLAINDHVILTDAGHFSFRAAGLL